MKPRFLLAIVVLGLATELPAQTTPSLDARVRAVLATAGPGVRFGIVVTDDSGREIVAIAPDDRFIPASNTKMFSTSVALTLLPDMTQPDARGGASVAIIGKDVVLTGHGDARLSGAGDCVSDCLSTLADAVAAKTRKVRDVIGDDTMFVDERWSSGMSWNNIGSTSGTAASALSIDDNEIALTVTPGAPGSPPTIAGPDYWAIDNRATSAAIGPGKVDTVRMPNSMTLRVTGSVGDRLVLHQGIDDPAHYAAWQLRRMLIARGVKVNGTVAVRHRAAGEARQAEAEALATLTPPPLIEDMTVTNKDSQNLHAELFMRRAGAVAGKDGSVADGIAAIGTMLTGAGVPRTAWDFSDGSGMSTYNRLAPRGVVRFLRWTTAQPWGAAWRATLPVAGIDGTLARRFKGTALEGRLFAKTGTLNATNALSGYMIGASGHTLTFSTFANDVPDGVRATPAVEAALLLIAAEN